MIIRMPLSRARTPNPLSTGNADLTFLAGGKDDSSQQQHGGAAAAASFSSSSMIAPVPASPYSFYTGDPSPQLANALCRGARVVRAHGLLSPLDRPESEQSVTMKLFGAFGNNSSSSNKNNKSPSSTNKKKSNNNKKNNKNQQETPGSRPPSGDARKLKRVDSAASDSSSVLMMNMTTVASSPTFTPEEEERIAKRTAQLLSGEVKALLEPKSIFFQPSLADAPLAAAQIVDEFSAGNARRKLIGVLNRTSGNDSALIALRKAQGIVKKVKRREDEAAEKAKKSQVGVEGESGENNNKNEGGGGGEENNNNDNNNGDDAAKRRRNKDKDPEEIAQIGRAHV